MTGSKARQWDREMAYTYPLSNLVHVVCQNVPHGLHVFWGKPFGSMYPLGPGNIIGGKPSIIFTSWQECHKSTNIRVGVLSSGTHVLA